MMKTEIPHFCKEYETLLRPLTTPLQNAISLIDRESRDDVFRGPLAGLIDVGHRLGTLVDKVEHQQAYLLIFGPLKSGKSTLMNAISGAYVSEVTSMPAYPALVYLGHGERQEFTVTRYNGSKLTLKDNSTLQAIINDSHASLAERIRMHEERGEEFDPGIHYPEAIRRVDVRLPVTNLRESGTVLVDTPGLYSRMKFGYDLMTRMFRNSAACAVFVVKTDNLFLEQVFAEFNQLLELFSRIFLVVNIDTSKMDLQPDGSLRRSLESVEPEKIIAAFESLAMSAPLRRAYEEGRLRIYPIDLLSSASTYLRKNQANQAALADAAAPAAARVPIWRPDNEPIPPETPSAAADNAEAPSSEAGEGTAPAAVETAPEDAAPVDRPARSLRTFEEFLEDLTDYLNSSNYLVEFMRDSLRQGATLCEEIGQHGEVESLPEFQRQQRELARQIQELRAKAEAARQLEGVDTKASFNRVREDNQRQTAEESKKVADQVSAELVKALDRWFESDDSLQALAETHWNPILKNLTGTASEGIQSRIRNLLGTANGGADLSVDVVRALGTVGFSLGEIHRPLLDKVSSTKAMPDCVVQVDDKTIPVRKTFLDWLLFRPQSSIRQRLFGPAESLDRAIPADLKRKRLLPAGRAALTALAEEHVRRNFPETPNAAADRLMNEYIDGFGRRFKERVATIKKALQEPQARLEAQAAANTRIVEALSRLREQAGTLHGEIEAMMVRYNCAPPAPEPPPEIAAETPAEPAPEVAAEAGAEAATEPASDSETATGSEAGASAASEGETPAAPADAATPAEASSAPSAEPVGEEKPAA